MTGGTLPTVGFVFFSNMVEKFKGGQHGIERRDAPDTSGQLTDMQNTLDSLTHTVNNLASKQQVATSCAHFGIRILHINLSMRKCMQK